MYSIINEKQGQMFQYKELFMNDEIKLQKAFEYIREIFFPRWDKKHQWIIRLDPDFPSIGCCDQEMKVIYIQCIFEDEDEFHSVLIHEICHSSYLGHSKKWATRMLRAAEKATKVGRPNLSKIIKKQVKNYENEKRLYARNVYEEIYDALLDVPEASYDAIIRWIARDVGLYSYELEERFKKCREVYDKAFKEVRHQLKIDAELKTK